MAVESANKSLYEELGDPQAWLAQQIDQAKADGSWVKIFPYHAWLRFMFVGLVGLAVTVAFLLYVGLRPAPMMGTLPSVALWLGWVLFPFVTEVLHYRAERGRFPVGIAVLGVATPWLVGYGLSLIVPEIPDVTWWFVAGGSVLVAAAGFFSNFWEHPNIPEPDDDRWRRRVEGFLRYDGGYSLAEVQELFATTGVATSSGVNARFGNPVAFATQHAKPHVAPFKSTVMLTVTPLLALLAGSVVALLPGVSSEGSGLLALLSAIVAGLWAATVVFKLDLMGVFASW